MKVKQEVVVFKPSDTWRFVFAGDFHYGSTLCDYELIRRFVRKYAGKAKTKIFLMGDEVDAIASSDKRFESVSLHEDYRGKRNFIDLIVEDFIGELDPLKGQVLAGVDSNHNKTYRKLSDSDPHYRISGGLSFDRLGYGGYVNVTWKRAGNAHKRPISTVFYITHGKCTPATTPGGSINTLASDAQWFISDIMAHGHTHRLSAGLSRVMFECDLKNETYRKRKQHLIQTGSFLKSYSMDEFSPYSEVKRYPPIDLGWAVCEVTFEDEVPRLKCYVEEF